MNHWHEVIYTVHWNLFDTHLSEKAPERGSRPSFQAVNPTESQESPLHFAHGQRRGYHWNNREVLAGWKHCDEMSFDSKLAANARLFSERTLGIQSYLLRRWDWGGCLSERKHPISIWMFCLLPAFTAASNTSADCEKRASSKSRGCATLGTQLLNFSFVMKGVSKSAQVQPKEDPGRTRRTRLSHVPSGSAQCFCFLHFSSAYVALCGNAVFSALALNQRGAESNYLKPFRQVRSSTSKVRKSKSPFGPTEYQGAVNIHSPLSCISFTQTPLGRSPSQKTCHL